MYKNCYISNMAVLISNMCFKLFMDGCVYLNDYDISKEKFCRYIANIRFMLAEFQIYYCEISYDALNNRYILIK